MSSLRGGPSRYPPKKLPAVLPGPGVTRHELPEALANRLLCEVLAQLAVRRTHELTSRPDPIVTYAGREYRLVGDLLEGTLYETRDLVPRFHIHEGQLRPRAGDQGAARWNVDASIPPVPALERVTYLMTEPRRARQEALPA